VWYCFQSAPGHRRASEIALPHVCVHSWWGEVLVGAGHVQGFIQHVGVADTATTLQVLCTCHTKNTINEIQNWLTDWIILEDSTTSAVDKPLYRFDNSVCFRLSNLYIKFSETQDLTLYWLVKAYRRLNRTILPPCSWSGSTIFRKMCNYLLVDPMWYPKTPETQSDCYLRIQRYVDWWNFWTVCVNSSICSHQKFYYWRTIWHNCQVFHVVKTEYIQGNS